MTAASQIPADADRFAHVDQWVFDLDNTLYPPEARLFDQIERRMTDWVMRELSVDRAEADRLRSAYWQSHGTTLRGLMDVHGVDPAAYLHEVHDIDLAHMVIDTRLATAIHALPGRKVVFTNGAETYARNVLSACGLEGLFDGIHGVETAGFYPKPDPRAYDRVFDRAGISGPQAAMFEDDPRNLVEAHRRGLVCVLVSPEPPAELPGHIDLHTSDLGGLLASLTSL